MKSEPSLFLDLVIIFPKFLLSAPLRHVAVQFTALPKAFSGHPNLIRTMNLEWDTTTAHTIVSSQSSPRTCSPSHTARPPSPSSSSTRVQQASMDHLTISVWKPSVVVEPRLCPERSIRSTHSELHGARDHRPHRLEPWHVFDVVSLAQARERQICGLSIVFPARVLTEASSIMVSRPCRVPTRKLQLSAKIPCVILFTVTHIFLVQFLSRGPIVVLSAPRTAPSAGTL